MKNCSKRKRKSEKETGLFCNGCRRYLLTLIEGKLVEGKGKRKVRLVSADVMEGTLGVITKLHVGDDERLNQQHFLLFTIIEQ